MDQHIAAMDAGRDNDLMICQAHGVAYQWDMQAGRVEYGTRYLAKIAAYDKATAAAVNAGRCALVQRHLPADGVLLDIGAGDGAFVRAARSWGIGAFGFDVIPDAVRALVADGLYDDDPGIWDAVTLWDTIEHLEDPALTLRRVARGALLFASVPIFGGLGDIRASKHYRPGEHLYYWTDAGFVAWMALYGFRLLERSTHETDAGRDSIGAFAFRRDVP